MTTIAIQSCNKRVVVVTGAASGIGHAIADAYTHKGADVIGIDCEHFEANYELINCNVCNEHEVLQAFEQIKSKYGKIQYLIHSAGIFMYQNRHRIDETDLTSWNKVLETNLTGTMLVLREAIPLLKNADGDRGIVTISSDQVAFPRSRNAAYSASKSGINSLTKLAASELLNAKIRVNGIAPASVRTNFIRELSGSDEQMNKIFERENMKMPFGMIEPSDIADLALFLGSENAKHITGQVILIDSGLYSKEE